MIAELDTQRSRGAGIGTILALSACAFCVLGSYAIARPSMKALLLQHYGKDALPYAWLLVALGVTMTVSVYSRFAARMDTSVVSLGCGVDMYRALFWLGLISLRS